MQVILVDDDPMELKGFEIECGQLRDVTLAGSFTSPLAALRFAERNPVDVALLDIDMPAMAGFALFDRLKELRPEMIAVFVTCHDSFAAQAMRKKADYILFKPYDWEEIEDVLFRIRLLQGRLNKQILCRTFGEFEAFAGERPIVFHSGKAKELLALCVSRQGIPLSCGEIIEILWPNYFGRVGECSIFRYTVKQLRDTLKQHSVSHVLFMNAAFAGCVGSALIMIYTELFLAMKKYSGPFEGS